MRSARRSRTAPRQGGRSCSSAPTPSAYAEAERLGHDVRSTQHFAADGVGARAAFSELSRATKERRLDLREGKAIDARDYFKGEKHADEDRKRRRRK